MKLLTKEICKRIPVLYGQEEIDDPVVHVKFFHPMSNWTWWATEAAAEVLVGEDIINVPLCDVEPDGDWWKCEKGSVEDIIFFGLVQGHEVELGYFSLREMEEVRVSGLGIERDLYWEPRALSIVREEIGDGR